MIISSGVYLIYVVLPSLIRNVFFQRIYVKMDFCFQRRESLLFLITKMVNVTLRANKPEAALN